MKNFFIAAGLLALAGFAINATDKTTKVEISPEKQAARERLRQLDKKNSQLRYVNTALPKDHFQRQRIAAGQRPIYGTCSSNSAKCEMFKAAQEWCAYGTNKAANCAAAEEMRRVYSGGVTDGDIGSYSF